jgi:hypothetical protein
MTVTKVKSENNLLTKRSSSDQMTSCPAFSQGIISCFFPTFLKGVKNNLQRIFSKCVWPFLKQTEISIIK